MRIALIEDEENLLRLYSEILKRAGHEIVITAQSGEEILLSTNEGQMKKVDLAIVDYRLAGAMNGLDVAKVIRSSSPGTKILIASADDSVSKQADLNGYSLIRKPFSLRKLEEFLTLESHRPMNAACT